MSFNQLSQPVPQQRGSFNVFFVLLILVCMNVSMLHSQENRPEILPFTYRADQPIVEGSINGKTAYFILDTGSSYTILHSRNSKQYGFKYGRWNREVELYGLGGSTRRLWVAYQIDLRLGTSKIMHPLVVADLSDLVRVFRGKTGRYISGIIGADMMDKYRIVIDYDHREVIIKGKRIRPSSMRNEIRLSQKPD